MKCPNCGYEMNSGDTFCSNCGTQITTSNAEKIIVNSNKNKTPWGAIIGTIIAIIAVIGILAIVNESVNDNTKTITYQNYEFTIPDSYSASISNDKLIVINKGNTLALAVIYQPGADYSYVSHNKDSIKSILAEQESSQSQGYSFTNAVTEEKQYGNTNFIITKYISQGTTDIDISYAPANDGVFVVSIAKTNSSITDNERDVLYSIVASGKATN